MQNLTVQKVCLALITLVFLIAAPWITSETLEGNSLPMVTLGGIAVVLLFVYGLGDRCWMIIPFCLPIEGNLNFVPFGFSIQELSIITVYCYLLLKMIFGQDVAWKIGPAMIWIPLGGVLAVLLYHWISSGDIGIKLLGGTGWGGRKYFKVAMAALTIPLLASYPGFKWQDLQKIPLVYFLGSFVDIVPELLTTFIPATAPLVWKIYSGVNLGEYGATLKGNFGGGEGVSRIGTLAKVGVASGLVCLCYFPPRTWLQPNRLWVIPCLLLGGLLCALSGFRNTIFRYGLVMLAGLFATVRFRTFLLAPFFVIGALVIGATQGTVFNYPKTIQRSLSFMPGNWDLKVAEDAEGSSRWRQKIDELFYKEYFRQAPLLGKGYHFDPNLAKQATDIYLAVAQARAVAGDEYGDVRSFLEMRQPHEGPVHILLVTGVVGAVFFVGFCMALMIYAFSSIWRTPSKQVAPIQIWALALLVPQVAGFFIVFGDLTSFLPQVCPVIALLYRYDRLKEILRKAPLPNLVQDPSAHETQPLLVSAAFPCHRGRPTGS